MRIAQLQAIRKDADTPERPNFKRRGEGCCSLSLSGEGGARAHRRREGEGAAAMTDRPDRFLGFAITPLTRRRIDAFKANRRGVWSLAIFLALFVVSLFAELVANDRPILVWYDGGLYAPFLRPIRRPPSAAPFPTETDYSDPEVRRLIDEKGWMLTPPIPFSYRTVAWDLPVPAPSPPDAQHWLGTDDQARDVLARTIYGFRLSVLFGFTLTIVSAIVGVAAGAVQGYFGGWVDLAFQRFMEVWSSVPTLYVLIILTSIVEPTFWWLLGILLLFSWMALRRRRPRRVPARPQLRLRARRPRAGGLRSGDHRPPRAAERRRRDD